MNKLGAKSLLMTSIQCKTTCIGVLLLLIAVFLSFSFNNIALTQYSFLFGQLCFYPLFILIIISRRYVNRNDFIFFVSVVTCVVISWFVNCENDVICTTRPFMSLMPISFVFLMVECVSKKIQHNNELAGQIVSVFIASSWACVLLSLPDIISVALGDIQLSFFESPLFKAVNQPYVTNRIRGFTQEPSYFGMVVSVLYPFCLCRIKNGINYTSNFLLFLLMWICLIFSMSKVGLVTCFILTILMFARNFRLIAFFVSFLTLLFWAGYIGLFDGLFTQNIHYINQWTADGVDISTKTRIGHMYAAIRIFCEYLFFGIGLGQSGYIIPFFYPDWIFSSPEINDWIASADVGGAPSFAFIPKLMAEFGLVGMAPILLIFIGLMNKVSKALQTSPDLIAYVYSFVAYMISSFGVEGYLYLPAWIVFACIVGICRNHTASGVNLKYIH